MSPPPPEKKNSRSRSKWLLVGLLFTSATACHTPKGHPPEAVSINAIGNGAYSLLYRLLSQEKKIDQLLVLKSEKEEVGELIVEIAQFAQDTADDLKEHARVDSSLVLDSAQLPGAEVKARESMAAARNKKLLLSKGQNFELLLLVSQHEALGYGAHLARVARDQEKNLQQRLRMEQVMTRFESLHDRVFQLLLSRMRTR